MFIILCMNLISCGKKKNESGNYTNFLESTSLDSDFDSISDLRELELGTDPEVANTPTFNFLFDEVLIGDRTFADKSDETLEDLQISNIISARLFQDDNSVVESFDSSLDRYLINCSKNEPDYFMNKVDPHVELKVRENSLQHDVFANIINGEVSFLFDQNKPSRSFNWSHLNRTLMTSFKGSGRCLKLEINDFEYEADGNRLSLKKTNDKIKQNLSHIYYQINGKRHKLSIVPDGKSFLDVLDKLKVEYVYKDDEFIFVDGVSNDFRINIDIKESTLINPENSRWFYGSNSNKLASEKLVAGDSYFLSYISIDKILESTGSLKEIKSSVLNDSIKLTNLQEGDRVILKIQQKIKANLRYEKHRLIPGIVFFNITRRIEDHHRANACHERFSHSISEVTSRELNKSRTVYIRKIIQKEDLEGGEFSLSADSLFAIDLSFTMHHNFSPVGIFRNSTEMRCKPGTKNYSEVVNLPLDKIYTVDAVLDEY